MNCCLGCKYGLTYLDISCEDGLFYIYISFKYWLAYFYIGSKYELAYLYIRCKYGLAAVKWKPRMITNLKNHEIFTLFVLLWCLPCYWLTVTVTFFFSIQLLTGYVQNRGLVSTCNHVSTFWILEVHNVHVMVSEVFYYFVSTSQTFDL